MQIRQIAILAFLVGFSGCQFARQSGGNSGRIEIGPNVRVSQDGDFPHVETTIASDPSNPDRMIVTATAAHFEKEDAPNSRCGMRIYYSADGGQSWKRAEVPALADIQGCNARVAFGPEGRGYFTTIEYRGTVQRIYTSDDGGASWAPTLDAGQRGDKPDLLVDTTAGPHRGTMYVLINLGNAYAVAASSDGGKSWTHTMMAPGPNEPPMTRMLEGTTIMQDGTVGLLYREFRQRPDKWWDLDMRFCAFDAGGKKHGEPFVICTRPCIQYQEPQPGAVVGTGNSAIGMASVVREPKTGRLVTVWNDWYPGAGNDLYWSYSDDQGKNWTPGQRLVPDAPAGSHRYQSCLAVNQEGVIGVFFLDTRAHANAGAFDGYFAASFDGGRSFKTPRRVTTAPSTPREYKKGFDWTRYIGGGDYLQMVVDAQGDFHPVWPDARHGGIQQIYTCTIRAERN